MAVQRDTSREEEISSLTHEYADLKMNIDELLPRMINIAKVAQCLRENGFKARKISYCGIEFENDTFGVYNDKLNSYEGFVTARLFQDCEDDELDLYIRTNFYQSLDIKHFSHEQKISCARKSLFAMEKLLNNFDEFEEKFYQYVEDPTPIN